jgi:hypothetical protein
MPTTIPRYLQARNLLFAKIQGGTVASDGTPTWTTAVDISLAGGTTRSFKAFQFSSAPVRENLRPSDFGVANYQIEYEDWTATLSEIIPSNGFGAINVLTNGYDYFRFDVAYKAPGQTNGMRFVIIGVRGENPSTIQAGENTASLTIYPSSYNIWQGATNDTPTI